MIRVIAGSLKGKKIPVTDIPDLRPTTDRMRERVFSILTHHRYPDLRRSRVADFFAGTGALGFEALSRGAEYVCFVEHNKRAVSAIKSLVTTFSLGSQVEILQQDATKAAHCSVPFDIIFMDPPYRLGLSEKALDMIFHHKWLASGGVIVAECHREETVILPAGFELEQRRTQGIQSSLFIRHSAES